MAAPARGPCGERGGRQRDHCRFGCHAQLAPDAQHQRINASFILAVQTLYNMYILGRSARGRRAAPQHLFGDSEAGTQVRHELLDADKVPHDILNVIL